MLVHPYFDIPRPHLFAHRGASGEAPENTRAAFERAVALGIRYLEMDCHATADGELVVLHDADLARTTDAEGPVRERRFAELERIDAGHRFTPDGGKTFPFRGRGVRIPRLVEILAAFPEARINLEVKQDEPPIAEEVVRAVRRAGAEASGAAWRPRTRRCWRSCARSIRAPLSARRSRTWSSSCARARRGGWRATAPAVTRCRFRPRRSASRW